MTKNDMASVSKNDGGAAKTREGGESAAGKRALSDDELREALSREHPLAQLPALVMANIEDVPSWGDSTALVTAHAHAFVLHSDLPEALTSLRTERDEARARQHEVPDEVHLKVSQALADLAAAEARALKAEAENKALREALEPFAARCEEAVRPDDAEDSGVTVKTRHLRKARALLPPSESQ